MQGMSGAGSDAAGVNHAAVNAAPEGATPSRRVVLLGASNLARGSSTVLETACRVWGRPLEVMAALGHGRSYGIETTVLGRRLAGIAGCGLWRALASRPPLATAALVTDVGNDLLYDVPPDRIAGWVRDCLDRLAEAGAATVLTALPLFNLAALSPLKFHLLRRVMYPRSRVDYPTIVERAKELDARLRDLAARRGARLVEQRPDWYGFDPLHTRWRVWPHAWREVLSPWRAGDEAPPPAGASALRWLYLRRLAPEQRWILGFEQRRAQPAGRLADGTTVWLF